MVAAPDGLLDEEMLEHAASTLITVAPAATASAVCRARPASRRRAGLGSLLPVCLIGASLSVIAR